MDADLPGDGADGTLLDESSRRRICCSRWSGITVGSQGRAQPDGRPGRWRLDAVREGRGSRRSQGVAGCSGRVREGRARPDVPDLPGGFGRGGSPQGAPARASTWWSWARVPSPPPGGGGRGSLMRHLRRPPLEVTLLAGRVHRPASRRRLVPPARPPAALPTPRGAVSRPAVDVPLVAAPAQHDLPTTAASLEPAVGLAERGVISGLDSRAATGGPDEGRRACPTPRLPRRSGGATPGLDLLQRRGATPTALNMRGPSSVAPLPAGGRGGRTASRVGRAAGRCARNGLRRCGGRPAVPAESRRWIGFVDRLSHCQSPNEERPRSKPRPFRRWCVEGESNPHSLSGH